MAQRTMTRRRLCSVLLPLIFHNNRAADAFSRCPSNIGRPSDFAIRISAKQSFNDESDFQNASYLHQSIENCDQEESIIGNEHDESVACCQPTISRRGALSLSLSSTAAASVIVLSTSKIANGDGIEPLEALEVGQGSWSMKQSADSNGGSTQMFPAIGEGGARFVPPAFATYAARFLLKYDTGASTWWSSIETKYSLLPDNERQSKLDENFGKFAKSVSIGLERYVQGTSDSFDVDPGSTSKKDRGMVRSKLTGVSISVSEKYKQIGNTLALRYTSKVSGEEGKEISRQLALLFGMLPPQYQPLTVLEQLVQVSSGRIDVPVVSPRSMNQKSGVLGMPESIRLKYDSLLPSTYSPLPYVASKDPASNGSNSFFYTISPPLSLVSTLQPTIGDKSLVSTPFGPLASVPLTRDKTATPLTYLLYGLSGGTGCALTHTVVVPLDVVKTRLQTDTRYEGIFDGATTIVREEGLSALLLGLRATIAGYFWYGISVYPSYSFFKYAMSTWLLSPGVAVANASVVALVAGALSAVLASLGLTPLEAARIRTVAEPDVYVPKGLTGTLATISSEDKLMDGDSNGLLRSLGLATLYAGLPSLMARQVIFGSLKFLSYEKCSDAIFAIWPFLRDGTGTALAVSLVAGGLAGSLSSVVSQPADSVLTYVAKQSGEGGKQMGVLEGSRIMIEEDGISSLFRGLGSRCLWAGSIIAGQFFLYDIFRSMFSVTADDLTQVWYLRL